MPILDAHAHIASWPTVRKSEAHLLRGMDRENVDISLISHADCSSFSHDGDNVDQPLSAYEGLQECLRFAKENPGRIFVAVWIKPRVEPIPDPKLLRLIKEDFSLVRAIKFHPFCERLAADDPLLEPYYDLAKELGLPILVHTALDDYSGIDHLVNAAKAHPDLRFVAAHLELGSDHRYAINAIKGHPNIFCDTAWVDLESAVLALETLGPNRVFFGTDAPIDGEDTLENPMYKEYFANKANLSLLGFLRLMGGNAMDFYSITPTE